MEDNEYYCGTKSGYVDIKFDNGDRYIGELKNGLFHGMGILISYQKFNRAGFKYVGDFKNGQFDGLGAYVDSQGFEYCGSFLNGRRHGIGITATQDRNIHIGDFIKGYPHGKGAYFQNTGSRFFGDFIERQRFGFGIKVERNGEISASYHEYGYELNNQILIKNRSADFFSPKSNYIVLDTETTGLPLNWNAPVTDTNNWPRLVQLAYQVFDKDGSIRTIRNFIVKPDGFSIPTESSKIHRITTERALKEGIPLKQVLEQLTFDLSMAKYAVAHNMSFDSKILDAEYHRLAIVSPLSNTKLLCTMTESVSIFDNEVYNGRKWPKLSELYFYLFEINQKEAHDASIDVDVTAKCFWELKKRGLFS